MGAATGDRRNPRLLANGIMLAANIAAVRGTDGLRRSSTSLGHVEAHGQQVGDAGGTSAGATGRATDKPTTTPSGNITNGYTRTLSV